METNNIYTYIYMTATKNKMVMKLVFAEPEFWNLLLRLSKIHGCHKPAVGSMSEAFRRFAKTGILKKSPNIKTIEGINWEEAY